MRMSTDQISTLGRVTQGTRLMKLKDNNVIATVSLVDKEKEEDEVVDNVEENNNPNNEILSESENIIENDNIEEENKEE